jgi:hypothetical protein
MKGVVCGHEPRNLTLMSLQNMRVIISSLNNLKFNALIADFLNLLHSPCQLYFVS